MQRYEYQVLPAPRRGEKARGLKSTAERFGHTLTGMMNAMAVDGWEYLRTDTLPCDERAGFTGRTTTFQTMLVFRRELPPSDEGDGPRLSAGTDDAVPLIPEPLVAPAPRLGSAVTQAGPAPALGAASPLVDPGPPPRGSVPH